MCLDVTLSHGSTVPWEWSLLDFSIYIRSHSFYDNIAYRISHVDMVLLIPFAPLVVGGAFLGTIVISTVSNIQQTINVRKEFEFNRNFLEKYHDDESSILSCYLQPNKDGLLQASVPNDKTSSEVFRDLKHMKRDEVIALFLSCPSPTDLKQIQGEWDGALLENNGLVMVSMFFCSIEFLDSLLFSMPNLFSPWKTFAFDNRQISLRWLQICGLAVAKNGMERRF